VEGADVGVVELILIGRVFGEVGSGGEAEVDDRGDAGGHVVANGEGKGTLKEGSLMSRRKGGEVVDGEGQGEMDVFVVL
jgi:hypothetical protein